MDSHKNTTIRNTKIMLQQKNILVDAGFEKKIVENSVAEIRKIVTTKKSVTGRNIESELEEFSNKIWYFRLNV